jgi:REP-associated tyrosine transposase
MQALKGRHIMSHAFVKNHIHLVFGVKDRRIKVVYEILPELWSYIAGICRNQEMAAIAVNGMNDHAHVLFHLPPVMSLADAVRLIKTNSSKWMNEQGGSFAWQPGYGAFSVSISNTAAVAEYIRQQDRHHRKMTFAQEYDALLHKHGMVMPPR